MILVVCCHYAGTSRSSLDRRRAAKADRRGSRGARARSLGLHPLGRHVVPLGQGAPGDRRSPGARLLGAGRRPVRGGGGSPGRADVAERVNRGEIWLLELRRPDKRRPVLVLSHPALIPLLHTATVAAGTSTRPGPPSQGVGDSPVGGKTPP